MTTTFGSEPFILDCTLRDGSYAIDFQFTSDDTALIVSALDSAGIRYIEVGHGLGLGASRKGKGQAAASDEDYIRSAIRAAIYAKIAVFFIPGIGTEDDIRMAADLGLAVLRIGTDIVQSELSEPFVRVAKRCNLLVCCNFMKSYAVTPEEFAQRAKKAEDWGADVVYLVDSAGGMLPEEVAEYLACTRSLSKVSLGFHGHDNLRMALANTLAAYEAGAVALDASLQGMGRSEGNCPTEVLAAVLQKKGVLATLNVDSLLDIGDAFIAPLAFSSKPSPLGVTAGRAQFHSAFLTTAMEVAHRFNLNVRQLILALGDQGKLTVSRDILEQKAEQLIGRKEARFWHVVFENDQTGTTASLTEQARDLCHKLRSEAKKKGLPSVLNVVLSSYEPSHVSPYVESSFGCAISNVMVETPQLGNEILNACDSIVDFFLIDLQGNLIPRYSDYKSGLLMYSDPTMWCHAVVSQIGAILGPCLTGTCIVVLGNQVLSAIVARLFMEHGADVATETILPQNLPDRTHGRTYRVEEVTARADCVVGMSQRKPCIYRELVEQLAPNTLIFDGGIGSIHADALAVSREKGLKVVRVDLRPTLAAKALELIGMKKVVNAHMGRAIWEEIPVVAGGIIGNAGDIIVDSITSPTRIIGVADGYGGITAADPNDDRVRTIRKVIALHLLGEKKLPPKEQS